MSAQKKQIFALSHFIASFKVNKGLEPPQQETGCIKFC